MNTRRNSNTREPLQHVHQNTNHLNPYCTRTDNSNSYSLPLNANSIRHKNIYPPQQQRRNRRKSAVNNKENKDSVKYLHHQRDSNMKQTKSNYNDSLFQKLSNLVTETKIQSDEGNHCKHEEQHDMFTPSTGNTPLLNTKITPKIHEDNQIEYSADFIKDAIGKDTMREDYRTTLLNEEKRNNALDWYHVNASSFVDRRSDAVDWLCCVGEEFELHRCTIYLSIYYFDQICSEQSVNVCHLQMVAASCLLIAIKYNEREEKVPSLYQLSAVCNKQYTPSEFKPMELKILNMLSFELKVVLPLHFVEYYIDVAIGGCVFDDDVLGSHCDLHLNEQSNVYLNKFAIFFCDMLCQNYSFYKYLPSMVAFAVIIASRRALKIEPYFNSKLLSLWNGDPVQIKQCFQEVWNEYHANFPHDATKAEELQPDSLENIECYPLGDAMDIDT